VKEDAAPPAMPENWCILRMGGGNTLRVAESLSDAGIPTWTPVEYQVRRVGRDRQRETITVPVMPTYVFAGAACLAYLLEITAAPSGLHPNFSVFRYFDRFPIISDASLEPLRACERNAAREKKPVNFRNGDIVRPTGGGFEGMSGIVEVQRGDYVLVCFPGWDIPIKIASWLL
jgi:hypothetical protein